MLLECLRDCHIVWLKAKDFNHCACLFLKEKACVDDLGVVEDQQGVFRKQGGQVVEMMLGNGSVFETEQL